MIEHGTDSGLARSFRLQSRQAPGRDAGTFAGMGFGLGGTVREYDYESLDGQDSVRQILMNTWPALATNQATH